MANISFKKVIILLLGIVALFIGYKAFQVRPSNSGNQNLKSNIITTKNKIKSINANKEKLTEPKVKTIITKDNINLTDSINSLKSQLTQGFNMAYNSTHTDADYSALKSKLPSLVGQSASNKIVTLDKPVVNQSGQKQFAFDKLKQLNISTGKYDYINHTLPVYAVVEYQSPEETDTYSGGSAGTTKSNDKVRTTGYNYFTMSYNTKTKAIELVSFKSATVGGSNNAN